MDDDAGSSSSSTTSNPFDDDDVFECKPVICIDPNDPKSYDAYVSSLPSGYSYVSRNVFSYLPPYPPTGDKLSIKPVLELYSVRILKLDASRKFLSAHLASSATCHVPMIVFEGEVAQGMSIPFRGPIRTSLPEEHLVLSLTNPQSPGWCFIHSAYGNPAVLEQDYDILFKEVFEDQLTDSKAVIHYQLIKSAVCAELEFFFTGNPDHTITSGCISARNHRDKDTERIIHLFPKNQIPNSGKFTVNRSVFGVPVGSKLVVSFRNFAYIKDGFQRRRRRKHPESMEVTSESETIKLPTHTVTFEARTKSCSEEKFFMIAGRKLLVRVSWREPRW